MNGFLFTYTIVVLFICSVASILSGATYATTHRHQLMVRCALFLFYAGDIVGIFESEWLAQNLPFPTEAYYEIGHPLYHTLMGAGVLLCAWVLLLDILDKHSRVLRATPVALYVLAQIIILYGLPYGPLRQWSYYTMRQVFIAGSLGYALACYRHSDDAVFRERLGRYRRTCAALVLLTILILVEDSFVIFVIPVDKVANTWFLLYLSSRNFSENLMMMFVAYLAIADSLKVLKIRSSQTPVAQAGREDDLKRHIEEGLLPYSQAHGLSPREREVLSMVLEGKDNRSIANELVLAEGTIKTHVHNIMKKTGTSSRDELKKDFWSS